MPAVAVAVAAAVVSDYVATAIVTDIAVDSFLGEMVLSGEISSGALAIGGKIAGGLVGAAVGGLTSSILNKNQQPAAEQSFASTARTALINTVSTIDAIPVIYGTRTVGGSRVLTEISGANGQYLNLVIVWGEGPISAINNLELDGVAITDPRFSGLYTQEDHLGADDQAASAALITELADSAKWNANCTLSGLAYTWLRLTWDATAFPGGLPNVTADIDGRTLYDPRDASTAFSHNAALAIRDYLTNTRYGCRVDSSLIDDTALGDAADTCDESVDIPGPSTQARYTCDGIVDVDQQPFSNLKALLTSCRGFMPFSGGQYKLRIEKAETPVSFTLSEDNIIGGWSFALGSKRTQFNRVRAQFFDAAQSWQPNTAIVENTTYRTEDNGVLLEPSQLSLPFTNNLYRAQQICQIEMNRSRFPIVVSLTATIAATQLEVGDVVPVTHATPGWVGKDFRVAEIELQYNDEVKLTLVEYDASVYDLTALTAPATSATSTLPDPRTVQPPGIASVTETLYETTGSAGVKARATVTIGAAADIYVQSGGGYQVEYQLTGANDWTVGGLGPGLTVLIDDMAPGNYLFRVKAYNSLGAFSAYSGSFPKSILGLTAPPSDMANFSLTPNGNQATLSWDTTVDLDVKLGGRAMVRWSPITSGATWNDGFEIANVPGGQTGVTVAHLSGTYMGRFLDSSSNQSTNMVSVITTAPDVTAFNAVASLTEHTAFTGAKSSVVVVDSKLQLDGAVLIDAMTDPIDSWGYVDSAGGVAASGTYDFSTYIDLSGTYTSRVTATLKTLAVDTNDLIDTRLDLIDDWGLIDGPQISDVNAELFIATTTDDPAGAPTWSSWRPFIIGDYKARAFKFRLVLTSDNLNHNIQVINLGVAVDMPDREDGARNVASGAALKTVSYTLSPVFKALPKIGITAKNMATGDYFVIANELVSSFDITFKNAAGAAVDRNFDWRAKGY